MPRKPGKRGYVSAKKKFVANRHSMENETTFASTSAKKLKDHDYNDIEINRSHSYVILDFLTVFNFLSEILKCKTCNADIRFSQTADRGLGFKLTVHCDCRERQVQSSPRVNKQAYAINRRLTMVMRLLGMGLHGVNLFCGLMDLSNGFSSKLYNACLENVFTASKAVFEVIRTKAASEEQELNEEMGNERTHLSVSGDGSWMRRGFSSLFGVTSLIGKYSKKVIDCQVKSSFCHTCNFEKSVMDSGQFEDWYESHKVNCSANHHGSAGKMEVDAVKEMFCRSEELFGVKYKYYIGDGDTKTFKGLLDLDPYPDVLVEKKECVGHVEKRMGTRLRNVKKENKGIGGKGHGKLTDKLIKNLTKYYGLAIRRHPDSVEEMRKEVWATFYHKCSTNDKPQHQNCPAGAQSWCKWRVAEATGQLDQFRHDPALTKEVQNAILPIYQALSDDDLLHRCLGGNTQNCNESLNACVWKLAPKHLFCGSKTVNVAMFLAVGIFNEGYSSILKTMCVMGIQVGVYSLQFARNTDEQRVAAAEKWLHPEVRLAMEKRIMAQELQNAFYEEEEGLMYGAGIAD